jgi:hypothetical protein
MVVAPLDICLDGTDLRVDYNIFFEGDQEPAFGTDKYEQLQTPK